MKKNLNHLKETLASKMLIEHEKIYLKGGTGGTGGSGGAGNPGPISMD